METRPEQMKSWIEIDALPTTTANEATHDRAVGRPAGCTISEASWKRFGAPDQHLLRALHSHFGAWDPSRAQEVLQAARRSLRPEVAADIDAACRTHYKAGQRWQQQEQAL